MGKKRGFLLIVVLLFFPFVGAATLNVPGDYLTIQDAINNASAGDVINVSAGVYDERLVIDKQVTLMGADGFSTIIRPENIPAPGVYDVEIDASGTIIKNFLFDFNNASDVREGQGIVVCDMNDPPVKNVQIIDNVIYTGDGKTGIQTGKNCDVGGLSIERNVFYGDETGFGEGVYVNPFFGSGKVEVRDNIFKGLLFSGVSIESGRVEVMGNIIDSNFSKGFYGVRFIDLEGGKGYSSVKISNNSIKNFSYGIRVGTSSDLGSVLTAEINLNTISGNDIGIWVRYGANLVKSIHYNSIFNNTDYGINNVGESQVNATHNWWGDCTGPGTVGKGSGDNVSNNVTYEPWLGACIHEKSLSSSCVIETTNITLYANVTSNVCIGDVIFSIYNGTWKNYSGTPSTNKPGNYSYTLDSEVYSGGDVINWTVYVEDCYGYSTKNGVESFYVNRKTNLSVLPTFPDGNNSWYISEPLFTLINPDATDFFYRWDSLGTVNYTGGFGIENAPNNSPNKIGGKLELFFWSNICDEDESSKEFYVDLVDPLIKNLFPANNSLLNKVPAISAYIDNANGLFLSGINQSSIVMKVDGGVVSPIISGGGGSLDYIINYTPGALANGIHTVYIYAENNAGRSSETSWNFDLNQSLVYSLEVYSPTETIYADRRVPINVSLGGEVAKIEYIDWSEEEPKWKRFCRNCEEYGYSRKKTKSFSEGMHNLTIKATDGFGNSDEKHVVFYVDYRDPRIRKVLPKKNKITNGSNFYLRYKEGNLVNVSVFWNPEITFSECGNLEEQECYFDLNLSDFDGEVINYTVTITDILNNSDSETIENVRVDTSAPVVNNPGSFFNYTNGSRYAFFNINITEENFEKVFYTYIDHRGRLRDRKLCSRLKDGICEKKKSFRRGEQNITVNILDEAGNSVVFPLSFVVDY